MTRIYSKVEFFKQDSNTCYRSLLLEMVRGTSVLRTSEANLKTAKVGLERFNCDYACIFDNVKEEVKDKELINIMKPNHVIYNK